jgi:hypothetical protein
MLFPVSLRAGPGGELNSKTKMYFIMMPVLNALIIKQIANKYTTLFFIMSNKLILPI